MYFCITCHSGMIIPVPQIYFFYFLLFACLFKSVYSEKHTTVLYHKSRCAHDTKYTLVLQSPARILPVVLEYSGFYTHKLSPQLRMTHYRTRYIHFLNFDAVIIASLTSEIMSD